MPAANKTDNIELNQWLGNEYPKREDFNADNLKIDTAIKEASDDLATHLADYTLQVPYATATGVANTYSATLNPAPTSLVNGLALAVRIPVDSTSSSTINVNGLGAKTIKKANGANVTNLKAGGIYTLRYDGVNFILQGEGASGNATASDLLSGKTATTDAGEIIGTIPSKGAATITPGTTDQVIAAGQFLSGSQTIAGSANLIAGNIKQGINLFGVIGNLESKQFFEKTGSIGANSTINLTIPFEPACVLSFVALSTSISACYPTGYGWQAVKTGAIYLTRDSSGNFSLKNDSTYAQSNYTVRAYG